MNSPIILFRAGNPEEERELEVAEKHFTVIRSRSNPVGANRLCVGRYAVLPLYQELVDDLAFQGSSLINSYAQHRYVADLRNWVEDEFLGTLTPKTWYRAEDVPQGEVGPFVVKGETNSRKADWRSHMYCPDRASISDRVWRLETDGLIGSGQQKIYVRKFEPFKRLLTGINDLPVTLEFRFFAVYGEVLCGAYYWSNYVDDLPEVPQVDPETLAFAKEVAAYLKDKIPFVVIDVAIDDNGRRRIVELNDGQFSGLSENTAESLYSSLANKLKP